MNSPPRFPHDSPSATPLSEDSQTWLLQAAASLGVPPPLAREFSRNAVLALPGLTLQLSLWQAEPIAQWVALGLLPRPAGLAAEAWSELLVRANCAVAAMSTCSLAMNEAGDGLLVQQLASRPRQDEISLGDELAHALALAESLVAGATALQAGVRSAGAHADTAPTPSPATTPSAKAAMDQQWHRPLLTQALQRLGITPPLPAQIQTVGVIQANARAFEVIADGDQHHLLVSTTLTTPLNTAQQRERALRANLQLQLLTR